MIYRLAPMHTEEHDITSQHAAGDQQFLKQSVAQMPRTHFVTESAVA